MRVYLKYFCTAFLAAVIIFTSVRYSTETAEVPMLYQSSSYITADSSDYIWPAPGSRTLTSLFGNRKISLYSSERFHTGLDIHDATGADVRSIQSGTVLVSTYDGGWGHYIIINHGDNILSLYAHLNSRNVERGDSVSAGELIGTVGNTGISSAPHLHFEMRKNGKSINPLQFTFSDS